jgi:hypothetical protein
MFFKYSSPDVPTEPPWKLSLINSPCEGIFCIGIHYPLQPFTPARRVKIVYRGLGRAFVVHKNRDLEGSAENF